MASDRIDTSYRSHLDATADDDTPIEQKIDTNTTILPQSSLAFDQMFLADTAPPQPVDKESKPLVKSSLSSISSRNISNDDQHNEQQSAVIKEKKEKNVIDTFPSRLPLSSDLSQSKRNVSRSELESNENAHNPYAF